MRTVAGWADTHLAGRIAAAVGSELAALGLTINFAPVVDVSTCATNPVIGDRAFGSDAQTCARFGAAWIGGLQSAGILATAKHFPGHGDTAKDSHLELPLVAQPRSRLEAVELEPFREAVRAGVAAIMTAHVVYTALDPDRPATLSYAVCTELRDAIGFDGILISDDLGMKAIAARWTLADAGIQAIAAGCDTLLVCRPEDEQKAVLEALVSEAERSAAFRVRCEVARARVEVARRRAKARPRTDDELAQAVGGSMSLIVAAEMAARQVA
jgi:beta-N-acetylhexosaminidase